MYRISTFILRGFKMSYCFVLFLAFLGFYFIFILQIIIGSQKIADIIQRGLVYSSPSVT